MALRAGLQTRSIADCSKRCVGAIPSLTANAYIRPCISVPGPTPSAARASSSSCATWKPGVSRNHSPYSTLSAGFNRTDPKRPERLHSAQKFVASLGDFRRRRICKQRSQPIRLLTPKPAATLSQVFTFVGRTTMSIFLERVALLKVIRHLPHGNHPYARMPEHVIE